MAQGQHINTFEKGMNKDYNVLFQPDGTYRNCINCQLISTDGNNYTIKDCMGTTRVFYINIPYSVYDPIAGLTYQDPPRPIGFISFPDTLIVFSTNNTSDAGQYGEIGKIQYITYGEGIQPLASSPANTYSGYVPLYHHISLKFTIQRQIEGFASEETEGIRRVYWTDHLNEPRVFNISDPIFTTYIATGSIGASGEQYMVLEGVVEYPVASTVFYGPGLSAGNVFTSTGAAAYTDMATPCLAKVIAYYPYQLLAFTPSRSMGTIKYKEYGTGNVYCGSKMYFYRLTDPTTGINTSWSYGCYPIHVGDTNDPIASPANVYFDAVGDGTTTTTVNSGKSVKIDISNIDTNFPRIQVACAEFDQLNDTPRLISIVEDVAITGADMVITHTGNTNLGTLTLSDVTLFPASILKCKTMTTNKGYMLIGNITEREEFQWADSTFTLSEISSRFPVHENLDVPGGIVTCANTIQYNDAVSIYANPTIIYAGVWYVVIFGDNGANTVTYGGTQYTSNQVFIGVIGFPTVAILGTGSLRGAFVRNRYNTTAAVPVREVITNIDGFLSYKSPARSHHQRGYWAAEKYRFALVPFDLKGNPMYARWLGDFTFSTLAATPLMTNTTTASYNFQFLETRGLSVSGITFTQTEIDQMSGFSIMRADRDKRIITEGMLMQLSYSGTLTKPWAGPTQGDSNWIPSLDRYYNYICPDALCGFPMPEYSAGNTYMEGNVFYSPTDYGIGQYMKTKDFTNAETRYFTQTSDAVSRKNPISAMETVNEATTVANFGSGNYTFGNNPKFQAATGNISENTCGGSTNYSNLTSVGGRSTLIETSTSVLDAISAVYSGTTSRDKLLIDVTVDNTNQYGGLSDTAKANTIYISTGHFQPITTVVKADVLTAGVYTFNNVEIWGGDCFTTLVDYVNVIPDGTPNQYGWELKFPCQTNCNYDLRRGRTGANNGVRNGGTSVTWPGRPESFNCNQAYASEGIQFAYPALPVNFVYGNDFPQRVRFAGEKFVGEAIDSYRVFLTNDYKDADGQYGEINNLITKRGQTIVAQNAQISTTPILERQLLAAQTGAPTTIGTGGVVDRFDPISTYFGNQHQHGMTTTEFGYVWFDMRRKAVVALDLSTGISEISKVDGMNGYFNEIIVDNLGSTVTNTTPLNSTTFSEVSDRPLTGVGITGVYDPKFKMTYLTFKFLNYAVTAQALSKDFTIAYDHSNKSFSHFMTWVPAISHNHNQIVVTSNNAKNKTKWYGSGMGATAFVVGDIVAYLFKEYICTTAGTVSAFTDPPAGGGSAWTLINTTNEIWVRNMPATLGQATAPDYQYNKEFGAVVDNTFEFVINPKTEESFEVVNLEQQGNNVYPTTITITADSQTATESVYTTSVNWRYIWDKICHNLPFSSTGRVVNKHLVVNLFKKNWTTVPTTLTGSVKILQYVKSKFTLKR